MTSIDIEGIMSALWEDKTDSLAIAALADYLGERGDNRGAEWVREKLSTRKPSINSDNRGIIVYSFYHSEKIAPHWRDALPKWLWEKMDNHYSLSVEMPGEKSYATESLAYAHLFAALLK